MPRRDKNSLPIYQVHIADGFSTDCDELVNRCLQLKTVDFKEFAKLWKEMNFDLLYEGRTSSAEIAELSEELIYIAKHYMVKNTSYFEESVTGLFLVYSLLHMQPFSGFAGFRLVPNDVRAVNRIETVARRERRLDVLYILGEVLVKWTQYHAEERPRGMEGVMRKYLDGYTSIDRMGVRPMGVFYRQNEELDHIRDLGSMTRQYVLAKKALFGEGINDPSLQYINENLPTELNTSLRKLVSGSIEDKDQKENVTAESSEEEKKTAENRSRTLQAIKAKAMSNAVDPMNHLTSAENRKKSNTTPIKSKSDLKTPTGKIKSGTHTRLITTSPKKAKSKKRKKNKRRPIGDLKDDSDDYADLDMYDLDQITDDDDDNDIDNDDEEREKKKPEDKKQDDNVELQNEQSINIDIDSLPLILRPGDFGPDIEIEIIDQQIPKGKKTKSGTTSSDDISVTTSSPKTTATTTTETPSSDEEEPLSVKAGVSFLKTYKRGRKEDIDELTDGFPLKKKEKRDLKRSDIKSRFAKLGLLPVGNFEDKVKEK